MSKIAPKALAPINTGIEHVVRDHGVPAEQVPWVDLAPAELPAHSQLDGLLALPNIDEFIASELKPRVDAVEILSPARFREVLDDTLSALRSTAEQNPHAARALGRAARLLADEVGMRDLLRMYRSALLQG